MEILMGTLILIIVVFILFYFLHSNNIEDSSIPYAKYKSYPIVGHLFAFVHDRGELLMKCRQLYGQYFRIRLLNQHFIMILCPSDWPSIIRNQSFYFPKHDLFANIFDVTSSFVDHPEFDTESHRQYIQYFKTHDSLQPLIVKFIRQIRELMKTEKVVLEKNGTLSEWISCGLLEFSHRMIFQPSTLTLFGEINPLSFEKEFLIFDNNFHHFSTALPRWIYSCFFSKELKARSKLNNSWLNNPNPLHESDLIQARKTHFLDNSDWLSEKDRNGTLTGVLWGSLGNTIPAVFWFLFYVLRDKKAIENIKQEIDTYLPMFSLDNDVDDSIINQWTIEKLNSCIYLESAVNETLRLVGASLITRKCNQQTQLVLHDGHTLHVKPNETIAWFAAITHRDPNIFPNPNEFIFDRFLYKHAETFPGFIPFGGGKSMCPGRFFAKNEIKICIAMLLRYMEYKFVDLEIIPIQKKQRIGFGVAPPSEDIPIMYRYKT